MSPSMSPKEYASAWTMMPPTEWPASTTFSNASLERPSRV